MPTHTQEKQLETLFLVPRTQSSRIIKVGLMKTEIALLNVNNV